MFGQQVIRFAGLLWLRLGFPTYHGRLFGSAFGRRQLRLRPCLHCEEFVRSIALAAYLALATLTASALGQSLEDDLKRQAPADLAALARSQGDAARGAVVFFQPQMQCGKCHAMDKARPASVGPDLTALAKDTSDAQLIEAVLEPSKVIRKGFEAVTVVTADGRSLVGILVERTPQRIAIREAQRGGEVTTIAAADIEQVVPSPTSLMPAGQVNQLTGRQQFLDLLRYLLEVRDGGQARALELQPPASLVALVIPEYEQHLDHAGLIGTWNDESLRRGEAIYQRVCANCHGTRDKPGSLPTSLRFAEGKFKNGSDPLSLYRTLTYGFGLMAPQTWMVPSQKYDVIHYIRQTYLKEHNPSQFAAVDAAYVAKLPKGDTLGPEPSKIVPWSAMDYGPTLAHTYQVPGLAKNFAYKGIAVRLDPGPGGVSRGKQWMIFDGDTLRMAAAWSGSGAASDNFIDWRGIQFNGEHGVHPHVVGHVALANGPGPGWANPAVEAAAAGSSAAEDADFQDDQRVLGRDGRRYGPLPRAWGRYRGMYLHGQEAVFSYTIGTSDVLEMPGLAGAEDSPDAPYFLRTFNIGPRATELRVQIAQAGPAGASMHPLAAAVVSWLPAASDRQAAVDPKSPVAASVKGDALLAGFAPRSAPLEWVVRGGRLLLRIPAGREPLRFTVWTRSQSPADITAVAAKQADRWSALRIQQPDRDLSQLTHGGPPRWPQKLETRAVLAPATGPFAADVLTAPEANPWLAQTRFTGLDFFADGRIAVCSWDGDVWIVEASSLLARNPGGEPQPPALRWQRIASGLFQPLGLKIVDGRIHVTCRDQLAVLHDLNGDGEIDFYQCLNNDHQVTEHFHEFAMGLQTDAQGNFYYAKSARHALPAVVPQHGTLLRVSKDGSRTDILANGFRAANGVCLNPDGSFVVTDQEGHWNPKNRINWVTLDPSGKPKFYGNMFGYHDVTDASDSAMQPPLCWITNAFDRSPAELLWVDSDRWGPLQGSLLNLSYGYGKVFVVPHEMVPGTDKSIQGGMIELPVPTFPTGVMRGRFHPADGQLYLCGMFAWAGNATQPGGLYRLRATGQPMHLPIGLHASRSGLKLTFTEPLDAAGLDAKNLHVATWSLKRTKDYGSKHYDERELQVRGARLSADGKTLAIDVADLRPTWCMEIKYTLRGSDGRVFQGTVHNTIHVLAEE